MFRDRGNIGLGICGFQEVEAGPKQIICMYSSCFMLSSSYHCYIWLGIYEGLCTSYNVTMFGKFHEQVYIASEIRYSTALLTTNSSYSNRLYLLL